MVVALVPYRWTTDNGMPHWALPAGVTSAIDLRPVAMHADKGSVGYAVAILDGQLPEGAVELETGNETRDRDAWESKLKFRPTGSNVQQWTCSQLLDGSDDAGMGAVRPLRGSRHKVELWLGGKHEFAISNTERLRQQVYTRRDLDRLMDDVEAGRLPLDVVRKTLQAVADEHGIDAATLRSKSARWRGVNPMAPTTTVTETWLDNTTNVDVNGYNGWAGTNDRGSLRTGNYSDGLGPKVIYNNTVYDQSGFVWNSTVMSNNRTSADLRGLKVLDPNGFGHRGPPIGGMIGAGGTTGYVFMNVTSGVIDLVKVSGTGGGATLLLSVARTTQSRENARVWSPAASTISYADRAGAAMGTVTDTTYTILNRVGIFLYHGGGTVKDATSFVGRDFLTPTVSSIAPSTGSTAGGTAVTITGTNFESTATVTIGGASATSVVVVSDTSITCVTPAGTIGAKDVVVTNPDGGFSGTLSSGFTYVTTTTTTTTTTTSTTTTSTSTTTTTTAASTSRPTLGGRGFGSPYIGGYRPGFMRKD